jgi:hypothetical protein
MPDHECQPRWRYCDVQLIDFNLALLICASIIEIGFNDLQDFHTAVRSTVCVSQLFLIGAGCWARLTRILAAAIAGRRAGIS